MGRGGGRTSALNIGRGPQSIGLIDPLGIWGPAGVFFDFDLSLITFTAGMSKRVGQGPFAAAPIIQGMWDGSGVPDVVTFPRGAQLGNPTGVLYANLDPYQGSIVFWITPEWDGDDGVTHFIFGEYINSPICIFKRFDDLLIVTHDTDALASVNVAAWNAGTTYCIVARWDSKNTLDGTNHGCISVNDVHTFGEPSSWSPIATQAAEPIGSDGNTDPASSIIEGLTVYRRPLWDGAYGVDVGNGDEINLIYAAGAGADPCTITKGSWDIPFCLPTDSTVGALTTGTTDAWSHPLESGSIEEHPLNDDGGYLGGAYAVVFNGTTTSINCGSDVDIDDVADNEFTAEAWIRADEWGESTVGRILLKGISVGWRLYIQATVGLVAVIDCATSDAVAQSGEDDFVPDGKWHHVVMYFNDAGDRKIYLAIDGRWISSYAWQPAGTGLVVSDVAEDLYIGSQSTGAFTFDGAIGWVAISNNDRHTVGTNFIPPRDFPADDANYLASWPMNEGTGAAIDNIGNQGGAGSGAANRDGTLANGTWEAQWDQDTTPIVPQSVEFKQENDGIDFGSGANIDDLPSADCTIEFWARIPKDIAGTGYVLAKTTNASANGFNIAIQTNGQYLCRFKLATTDALLASATGFNDDAWHHVVVDWDVGTLTGRFLVDGVLSTGFTGTGVGAYQSDAAANLIVNGVTSVGVGDRNFAIGPIRIRNDRAYTGTYFIPASRTNWHANDANTHLLIAMTDGAGATVTDTSGNAYNGTITFGANTKWHNTIDMEVDCPGGRMFHGGYGFGADAANDGLTQIVTGLTAGDDYVVRVPISWDPDVVAQPAIRIYDEINAAQIVQFAAPLLTGAHTGANNSATLVVAGARFTQSLVGATLDNVTDGSTTTITAVSGDGTTITGVLAGGTDDDWDTGDVFRIRTPMNRPWVETFCFTLPALCTSISIQVRNLTNEGVIYVHQVEVLENLLQTGDMEAGAGNPYIPTGWVNVGLAAGESVAEAAIIHSGAQSLEFVAAADGDGISQQITAAVGSYVHVSMWTYGDGSTGFTIGGLNATQLLLQSSTTAFNVSTPHTAAWSRTSAVFRVIVANPSIYILADAGAVGLRYIDDVSVFVDGPVTLTVTPASEANSLESSGIRVDGQDQAYQPAPVAILAPNSGTIRFTWIPRHSDTLAVSFGNPSGWLLRIDGGANNYIDLVWNAADNLRLQFNANGAGIQIGNWATGGGAIVPATPYAMRITYNATRMQLYVDDVLRITINAPTGFTWADPMVAYWGSTDTSINQADAVYAPPT